MCLLVSTCFIFLLSCCRVLQFSGLKQQFILQGSGCQKSSVGLNGLHVLWGSGRISLLLMSGGDWSHPWAQGLVPASHGLLFCLKPSSAMVYEDF